MTIFNDIEIMRHFLGMFKLLAEDETSRAAQAPIHNAMERVAQFAYENAVKDMAESGMETLEKIMKGDKLQ